MGLKTIWNKGLTKETDKRVLKYSNSRKGQKFSEESIKNMSLSHKGQIPWIKGKKHSEKTKLIMKMNHKGFIGRHHSEEAKKKMSLIRKGWNPSKETRAKISKNSWMKGRKRTKESIEKGLETKKRNGYIISEETKRKIGIGNSISLKGKHHSDEARKKMSESKKGTKSHFWKGGISYEPYSIDWTNTLKRAIRERDHYICKICNNEGNQVHHIDYNKKNCNLNNLITLCRKCHAQTNSNRRYWINILIQLQNNV